MISDQLREEAKAFDARILERVENGLVPDIRKAARVDWFYNNPWRRPAFVNMIFGDYFDFARRYLPSAPARVLEIGSGLGHMSLELSRAGYAVTGIELSPESVRIASQYYGSLPAEERGPGSVTYVNDDFMNWEPQGSFDAVCLFLTLHHFEDPGVIIKRVESLLTSSGTIIVIEPARDLFSFRDAAIAGLIRILLSANNKWYQPVAIPTSHEELRSYIVDVWNEYTEAKEKTEKEQSPHDNSSYANDMLTALRKSFQEVMLTNGNTLTPRMVGGVRGESDEEVRQLTSFLKLFDEFATGEKILEPGVIYFAGKLKTKL